MTEVEVWALEIVPIDQEIDSHARTLRRTLHDLGARSSDVTHGRLYILQSSNEQREAVTNAAIGLALDPVLARVGSCPHPLTRDRTRRVPGGCPACAQGEGKRLGAEFSGWIIEVQPHPGVTDAEGDTLAQALTRDGFCGVRARAGHRYHIGGELSESLIGEVARELAHDVVERVSWRHAGVAPEEAWWKGAFMPDASPDPTVECVPLRHLDDDALLALSRQRLLSLPMEDLRTIQGHFTTLDRDPTDVELETIAQTWSEHCAHRTFKATIRHREPDRDDQEIRGLLKTFIMSATNEVNRPWVLSAFRDNAGVIAFDRGHEISFKVETHNHPSALEPFGGANTGVGGVVRDVLGVSAEPIANTDVLCFGPLDAGADSLPPGTFPPEEIYEGVVAGIADYGNKMGIPTVNGATLFDTGYVANPLVFCGTVGLAPRNRRPTQPEVGDLVVVAGGRAGRDGIHGATFSSDVLGAPHAELGSVVQIGDPIVEKRLADALPKARDRGLYNAVTDCGAGGLSSAVGEMASELGADVELATVPLKYDGLRPWEIWLSEAQERLVFAVPPRKWPEMQQVFAGEGVEATAIGRFTGDGQLRVRYDGEIVADLSGEFLHDGMPVRTLDSVWYPAEIEQDAAETDVLGDLTTILHRVLSDPNVASKESLVRHYDHEVQARTVGKPFVGPNDDGPADAAVLRPVATSWKGIAVSCGINPWYGEIDPYGMALLVIDEALRNAVAVGADPSRTAILDNFCWGNPMLPDRLGGLVRAASGCHDAAVALRLPFISGKDSLYNEYRLGDGVSHPIPGTLLISAIGIVPDIRQTVSMAVKEPESFLYLVGRTQREMGGSVVSRLSGVSGGTLPALDLKRAREIHSAMHRAIRRGLVRACHDLSEGGLAVAAAEMAMAGGFGVDLNIAGLAGAGFEELEFTILFGESPTRYLVEVAPENLVAFEQAMGRSPRMIVGEVMAGPSFTIMNRDTLLIETDIASLKRSWQQPLAAREVVA